MLEKIELVEWDSFGIEKLATAIWEIVCLIVVNCGWHSLIVKLNYLGVFRDEIMALKLITFPKRVGVSPSSFDYTQIKIQTSKTCHLLVRMQN